MLEAALSRHDRPVQEMPLDVAHAIAECLTASGEPAAPADLAGGLWGVGVESGWGADGRWTLIVGLDEAAGWWVFGEHPDAREQQPVVLLGQFPISQLVARVRAVADRVARELPFDGTVRLADLTS